MHVLVMDLNHLSPGPASVTEQARITLVTCSMKAVGHTICLLEYLFVLNVIAQDDAIKEAIDLFFLCHFKAD